METNDRDYIKKFLTAGTERGVGDLSIMVGVLAEILTTHEREVRSEERNEVQVSIMAEAHKHAITDGTPYPKITLHQLDKIVAGDYHKRLRDIKEDFDENLFRQSAWYKAEREMIKEEERERYEKILTPLLETMSDPRAGGTWNELAKEIHHELDQDKK